jgi:hypothetical protein
LFLSFVLSTSLYILSKGNINQSGTARHAALELKHHSKYPPMASGTSQGIDIMIFSTAFEHWGGRTEDRIKPSCFRINVKKLKPDFERRSDGQSHMPRKRLPRLEEMGGKLLRRGQSPSPG